MPKYILYACMCVCVYYVRFFDDARFGYDTKKLFISKSIQPPLSCVDEIVVGQ